MKDWFICLTCSLSSGHLEKDARGKLIHFFPPLVSPLHVHSESGARGRLDYSSHVVHLQYM